jgi:deazaflavin-dependent oxidoreductase (nitroreductase family)
MTILDPRTEEVLRQTFKRFNPFMVFMWRLGLAPFINIWPEVGGQIMMIEHRGRRSGRRRYAPVNYAIVEGELYCTAGFGPVSDWYRNIVANPNIEVWMTDGWWAGAVEDVSDCENRLALLRKVLIGSGVVTYMAGIDPVKLSDEAFDAVTKTYRLLHIRRTEARTGPGGPGDLAWVWPLASMILLPLVLLRRGRKG